MTEFHFTPRDYQLKARHEVNKHVRKKGNPILVMPTGTGKSKTSAMIISDQIKLGKIVYVLCPQVEIFTQLMRDYAFLDPGYINDEGMRGKNRKLYVCMAISLSNLLPMIPESLYPDVIVTDESHHSKAETWENIYSYFSKANRVGMTATPVRTDGKPLGDLYDKIIEPITIREALDRGYLTEPIVIAPEEFEENIVDLPMDDTKENRDKQAELLGDPKIIGDVIDTYERVLNGLPMLVACASFDHADNVRDSFRDAGWTSEHIHSGLSKQDRKSMLSRIATGKINVLTTVGIGIEGMDIPNLHALAWLRRTMSTTIFVQFNGRPMRLAEGKENCFIFDFVGNCVIHGMPDRVRKWNLETGEDEEETEKIPFKKCWNCGTYNNPENDNCHWCGEYIGDDIGALQGTCRFCKWKNDDKKFPQCACPFWAHFPGCPWFERKQRSLPAMVDGKLIAITTDGQRMELRDRVKERKEDQQEELRKEDEKRLKAEKITTVEKRRTLQQGLFADSSRMNLFKEALGKL